MQGPDVGQAYGIPWHIVGIVDDVILSIGQACDVSYVAYGHEVMGEGRVGRDRWRYGVVDGDGCWARRWYENSQWPGRWPVAANGRWVN